MQIKALMIWKFNPIAFWNCISEGERGAFHFFLLLLPAQRSQSLVLGVVTFPWFKLQSTGRTYERVKEEEITG